MTDVAHHHLHAHRRGPCLATYSFLPIQAFTKSAGVTVETRDISLSGRVLVPLQTPSPRTSGWTTPSPSRQAGQDARSQHHQVAEHLRIRAPTQGHHRRVAGPRLRADYPEEPENDAEASIKARYDKVKGSAVDGPA